MVKAKTLEDFEGYVAAVGLDGDDGNRYEEGDPLPAEFLIVNRSLVRSGKAVKGAY